MEQEVFLECLVLNPDSQQPKLRGYHLVMVYELLVALCEGREYSNYLRRRLGFQRVGAICAETLMSWVGEGLEIQCSHALDQVRPRPEYAADSYFRSYSGSPVSLAISLKGMRPFASPNSLRMPLGVSSRC
jgi:hypothetical protein